ncbi:MAG: ABC transporter substrate-binding protein [Dehalococcoidia bacterium]|nr:ABC transporter substrate-binding protein [Dehalococcoidia bacterium]
MGYDRADQIWERPLTRRQLMGAMAVGGTSLALVGCGDDDDGAEPSGTQVAGQPKKGGTLTLRAATAVNITDPHKDISVTGPADIWALLGNTVLRFNWKKGVPVDGIAEKWEFPDPLTLVLTLKKGVHFQKESLAQGREVDSGDVVAGLERARTSGDATFTIAGRFRLVDTYTAVDKYTVRVKFKKPDANFLCWMYHPNAGVVLPREAYAKHGAAFANQPEIWYGSGPFVVDQSSFKTGISMSLKRNPSYDVDPGGLPYLDQINLLYIQDNSTREAAFRTGQIDIMQMPTLAAKSFQNSHQVESTEDTVTAVSHLAMNTQLAPTKDVRVRQALHRIIDREELIQVVGDGFGCTDIILGCRSELYLTSKEWEGKPGFRKNKNDDLTEARQLLTAAGIDPTKTTLKIWHSAGSEFKVIYDMPIAVRGMLNRFGFKIEPFTELTSITPAQTIANNIHLTSISDGGLGGLIFDDPIWKTMHSDYTLSVRNNALWQDKQTDTLVEKQQEQLDLNDRKKTWAELQRYLMEEKNLPVAPVVRNYDFYGAKKTVKNWTTPGYFLSNYAWQFNKVWLDQ